MARSQPDRPPSPVCGSGLPVTQLTPARAGIGRNGTLHLCIPSTRVCCVRFNVLGLSAGCIVCTCRIGFPSPHLHNVHRRNFFNSPSGSYNLRVLLFIAFRSSSVIVVWFPVLTTCNCVRM
ncbi:hypothetical protein PYCCODRAFT_734033 [Trametes coccinea BRFM310]|uniref:Uncharacterized protein n=1 Tax=Trametes coccinea (strain BRFM310) TaxID=1353009 RepID=A0A1Y2IHY0_TRAC3|nr:hypothetical protein PYCCODRAFT_734033 [Trametes coccinea BRFM310]